MRIRFAGAALGTVALVTLGLTAGVAQASTGTDGPYSYSTTDGGQCGNTWANETGNRSFTRGGTNTTNTITEKFTQVHWSTTPGVAPGNLQPNEDGACPGSDMVAGGVVGFMYGFETLVIQGAAYTPGDGSCNGGAGPCTTDSYVAYHYPGATYTVTAYKFTYKEPHSGTLSTAVAADKAWVENCPTACANNGYDEQNYSRGNIATSE